MSAIVIIVLALSICLAFATRLPRAAESRIIGGRPAGIGACPYQVSIRHSRRGSHFCGGSIIDSAWVLTAAHCVSNLRPEDLMIVVGTNFLNSGGQSYRIAEIISHSGYNVQNSHANDIALLRINGQIFGGPGVARIALADSITPPGSPLVLSGWGVTSYPTNSLPNALQTIILRSISIGQCQQLLRLYPVFSTHLCTYTAAGKGACLGDSGGPLVLNRVQHGIVSWGIPCAKGRPDVFTSVSSYRAWIRSIAGV